MSNHRPRRERERRELRIKMLDAANRLFNAGGEAAVTLRKVAELVEYSPTAIYLHFPDKESLLLASCAAEFGFFSRGLQQAQHLSDPMERLRKTAAIYVDFGLQHPEHYRVLFLRNAAGKRREGVPGPFDPAANVNAAAPESADVRDSTLRLHDGLEPYAYLENAAFKAVAAGCFKPEYQDTSLLAQVIWSCLHGVVALHLVRTQHAGVRWKPVQTIFEATLEGLLNGLTVSACQIPPTWRR